MSEPTDEVLAEWLHSTSGGGLTSEDIAEYQGAVAAIVADVRPDTWADLVELAFVGGRPRQRDWVVDAARTKRGAIPLNENNEVMALLAAASCVRAMSTLGSASAVPLGLLVKSASFLGLQPKLPEVLAFAETTLDDAAVAARERPEPWQPIAAAVAADLDGPTVSEPNEAGETTEIDVHRNAITRLARSVDELAKRLETRLQSLDEEYDALWWSYTARSEGTGETWSEVQPLDRRVVLAATELGRHLQRVPSPRMVRGLLAAALSDGVNTKLSLAEVAMAAAAENCFPGTDRALRLLPIESSVCEIRRLNDAAGNTWKDSLKKALYLDASREITALDAACQLRREIEIGSLLV
jgi:hypothetical protein